MGLIRAAFGAAGSVMADQWKEYFYCEALPADTLAVMGQKRVSKHSANRIKDNIISNGSVIAVADGQCMMIVEQGKIVDVCAEPGEYVYDYSTEPSVFCGELGENIKAVFRNIGKRFSFGGEAPKDQRVYYFNTKEIVGNKYGTPTPIPFRVVDSNINLQLDISLRCFGEYSYRLTNPLLFYTNVCGNVSGAYKKSELEGQMRTELLTALQPAFAKIGASGVIYSQIPAHTYELSDILKTELSDTWGNLRGIEIVSIGVNSVKASEEDEKMIKELQRNAAFRDPSMAAAQLVGAQARAMQDAARNAGGAAMAFMGMNMAGNAGGANVENLYNMAAQQRSAQQQAAAEKMPSAEEVAAGSWQCPNCGIWMTGKFCTECGRKKPAPKAAEGWTCPGCGTLNKGKFCTECGTKKPAGALQYRCDKCGWEPAKGAKLPKFCPECGDPFDDGDIVK